jgi:penicillin-binding protein 1C
VRNRERCSLPRRASEQSSRFCAAALALCAACAVPPAELSLDRAVSLRVEARDGTLLREFASRGEGHAAPAHLSELPPHVWQAFIVQEDRRFFSHHGIDVLALGRAFFHDLKARRFAQGGSTLTMQLARLIRPYPRTLRGKLYEIYFAFRLERTLNKRELLEQYLTRVPLGNDVRGIEAAARLYFDRPAAALNREQARFLASLARRPANARPDAKGAPLDWSAAKLRRAFEAPHFVEAIARHETPETAVRVRTTLDLALQQKVEAALREQIKALAGDRAGSAAAVVLDNATGAVLAYAGSHDWFDEEHQGRIDGARTLRQPGSALKPFAYAEAIERHGLTAATLLSDVESHFSAGGGDWVPKNYDRRAHGPVRARVALASSYNVPAVKVAERVTAQDLLDTLHSAGFSSLHEDAEHYGLGLVLGDGEVTLLELARAYSTLARGGLYRDLKFVQTAQDAQGHELPLAKPSEHRVFSRASAAIVADILSDPAARAPAFGLDNALRFSFPAAAKTGTSRAFTDNWTAGFTRERTVAVWVGNMSGETMHHVSGITGAGPLFHRILTLAMDGVEPQPLYEAALEEQEICALSGQLKGPHCPSSIKEKFAPGTAPHEQCEMHRAAGTDLGPRFYDWAAHEGVRTLAQPSSAAAHASLAFPREGDEFQRGADLPDQFQTIPVRALAPKGGGALELQLDGGPRESLAAPFSTRVRASNGRHILKLFRTGEREPDARAAFTVSG